MRLAGLAVVIGLALAGGAHAAGWTYDPETKVASVKDGSGSLSFDCSNGFFSAELSYGGPVGGIADDDTMVVALSPDAAGLAAAPTFVSDSVMIYGETEAEVHFYSKSAPNLAQAVQATTGELVVWGEHGPDPDVSKFVEWQRFSSAGAAEAIDTVLAGCRAAGGIRPETYEWPASTPMERWPKGESAEIERLLAQAQGLVQLVHDDAEQRKENLAAAEALLDQAVALDSDVARLQLARLLGGYAGDEADAKVKALYTTLHEHGVPEGTAGLAQIVALIERDWVNGLPLLTTSANAGDAQSMYLLYIAYDEGDGVEADSVLARRWLEKAADAGRSTAQTKLAQLLYVEGNSTAAWHYLKGAIEKNEFGAWPLAGIFYETGEGGAPLDRKEAIKAYQRGSANYSSNSQFYLAGLYDHGKGVTDPELAAITLHQALRLNGEEVSASLATGFKDFSKTTRKELQKLLKRIGDYDGAIDGIIGKKTIATLRERYER